MNDKKKVLPPLLASSSDQCQDPDCDTNEHRHTLLDAFLPPIKRDLIGATVTENNDYEASSADESTIIPFHASPVERWACVLTLTLVATLCGTDLYIVPYLFAVNSEKSSVSIEIDLNLSDTDYGLLMSYIGIVPRLIVIMITAYLSGEYPDRKRQLIVGSCLILIVGLVIICFTTNFWQLAVAIVVVNIGIGMNAPMNAILVSDIFERRNRALPIAAITCSDYLGGGLCGPAGSFALTYGWRVAVGIYLAFTIFVFVLSLIFVLPTPRSRGSFDETHAMSFSSGFGDGDEKEKLHGSIDEESYAEESSHGKQDHQGHITVTRNIAGLGAIPIDTTNGYCGAATSSPNIPVGFFNLVTITESNVSEEDEAPELNRETMVSIGRGGECEDRAGSIRYSVIDGSAGPDDPGLAANLMLVFASPRLLLLYAAGGCRFAGAMSIFSYNPVFFSDLFPDDYALAYSMHATLSIIVCGSAAQLASGYITQHYIKGLRMPIICCLLGGISSAAMYMQTSFVGAIALLYATWFLGEGWFVGTVTGLQRLLPPGPARDSGLGLFFASSVLIGASNVFTTSQDGIGDNADDYSDDAFYEVCVQPIHRSILNFMSFFLCRCGNSLISRVASRTHCGGQ